MRKAKKEIEEKAVIEELLHTCGVGRLGTIAEDGYPMVKPLNFVYQAGRIYFHTAKEGEKISDIKRDGRVCFEVDLPIAFVRGLPGDPCKATYLYRSVIIKGRARMVTGREEKRSALSELMKKYQPEGGYGDFPEQKLALTGVVRIDIEELVGKEHLGKEHHRNAVNKALRKRTGLPIVLDP